MRIEKSELTAKERLLRMRRMFADEGGVLAEDYEYFTRQRDVSTPRNKAARKSAT
jgi:hypothetical protein